MVATLDFHKSIDTLVLEELRAPRTEIHQKVLNPAQPANPLDLALAGFSQGPQSVPISQDASRTAISQNLSRSLFGEWPPGPLERQEVPAQKELLFAQAAGGLQLHISDGSLLWNGTTNKAYQVLQTTDLKNWELRDQPTTNTNVPLEVSGPRKFFKLREIDPLVGGEIIGVQTNGALSGTVNIQGAAYAIAPRALTQVHLLVDGSPAVVTNTPDASGLLNFNFPLNTALYSNGVHNLQLRVIDSDSANGGLEQSTNTPPVRVNFDNAAWAVDWPGGIQARLVFSFGTRLNQGTATVDVLDQAGASWGHLTYNLATAKDPSGKITLSDGAPGNIVPYPVDYFDIVVTVRPPGVVAAGFPPAADPPGPTTNRFRMPNSQRPLETSKMIVIQQTQIFSQRIENDVGEMMKVVLEGCGTYVPQYYLSGGQFQLGAGETVDEVYDRPTWASLRQALQHKTVAPLQGVTHFFYFGHGAPSFIGLNPLGANNVGAKSANFVRSQDLVDRPKISFVFLDGCHTAEGDLIPNLIGTAGTISRQQVINQGLYPVFGAGWTKAKTIGFANNADPGHLTLIGNFISNMVEPDPVFGYPIYTISQAWSNAVNTSAATRDASKGIKFFGCTNCYFDDFLGIGTPSKP